LSEREPLLSQAAQQGRRLELRDLERAIGKLPDAQRSVILLVGLEGMRYEEVAVVLNVPVGTIRSRLSRARESLRRLTDSLPEEETRTARPHTSPYASRHLAPETAETPADQPRPWSPRRTRLVAERKQAEASV